VHVRLAALKLVDSGALPTEFHYAIANIYDVGKTDLIESRGEAENDRRRGH